MGKYCSCEICKTYQRYIWAVVMECKCGCHDGDGMCGHDRLCCSIPNGLRRNNPFQDLESLEFLQKEMNRFDEEGEETYKVWSDKRYCDEMYETCKLLPGEDRFGYIHEEIVRHVKHKNWKIVNDMINMFIANMLINEDESPTYLNSAMVTIKGLKDTEELKEVWNKGYKVLKDKNLI